MTWSWRGLVGAALVALAATGCSSVVCGDDTREENGQCVPAGLARCGPGTALVGSECKPVCGSGLSAEKSGCVVSNAACGPGTELFEGVCHAADPMRWVTDAESTEPNDSVPAAKAFALPAVGAPAKVLGGIVDAVHDGQADFDWFVFEAPALTRVRIEAKAVGAPAVGVVLEPAAGEPSLRRFVVDLSARNATREITLPTGGQWVVKVSELSNLNEFLPGPARGGTSFSYAVSVTQLAAASARPLSVDGPVTGTVGDGDVFDVPNDSGGALLYQVAFAPPSGGAPFPGARALWATDAEGNLTLDAADAVEDGELTPMATPTLIVPPGGVRLGVDYLFALGDPKTPYQLSLTPVELGQISAPFPSENDGSLEPGKARIYALDVGPNSLVAAELYDQGYDLSGRLELRDPRFHLVAADDDSFDAFVSTFVPAGKEGRYFLVVSDRFPRPRDTDLTFTLGVDGAQATALGPVPVPGSDVQSGQLAAGEVAWFAVSVTDKAMLNITLNPEAGMDVSATAYSTQLTTIKPRQRGSAGVPVVLENLFAQQGGVILVKVESSSGGAVSVQAETQEPPFKLETEPNNSMATAEPLVLDPANPATVAGFLDTDNDVDFFKIEVPTGTSVKLTIETEEGLFGGTPDTYVTLYSAAGSKLGEDDDSGPGLLSYLTKSDVAPGTYYIAVKYAPLASAFVDRDYLLKVSASIQ